MFLSAALGAAALSTPAFAQDDPAGSSRQDVASEGAARLSIAAGVAMIPDYEGSDDTRWTPVPAANGTIAGMSFTVLGSRASMDLIPNGTGPGWDLQLGPVAVINLNRTNRDAIDDSRVAALGEVDTAVELGGYVGIARTGLITSDYDKLTVSVSYRYDVTGIHKSGIVTPSIAYATPLSTKALVGLFASAEIVEDEYAGTYFGITPAGSAASGLPVFMPRGGQKDISVGGMLTYAVAGDLTKGLSIVTGFSYRKLVGDFADSPIVSIAGSRHNWLFGAGLALTL